MKVINSKKAISPGNKPPAEQQLPSQNSLKVKGSLVYLSSCLLKKKGKEEERDNLQNYKIQCGQTTPCSPPYNWVFITKQIDEKVANFATSDKHKISNIVTNIHTETGVLRTKSEISVKVATLPDSILHLEI